MAVVESVQVPQIKQTTSVFNRGSEVLVYKVWSRIQSKDKYHCWYINEFADMKENPQKIRKALKELVKKGYVHEIKAYPVFWEKLV